MTTILPTHRCFDNSLDYLALAVKEDCPWAEEHLRLVHGICLAPEGPREGEPFAHAWVEQDAAVVIQAGVIDGETGYYAIARRDHYKFLRVQLTTVYTVEEAWSKNRETLTYGPWEPAYAALCGRGDRVVFRNATD